MGFNSGFKGLKQLNQAYLLHVLHAQLTASILVWWLSPCGRGLPCEDNSFTASQEIPRILRNPMVDYRIRNSPPPGPNLSHMNPFHALPSHFFQNNFNIICPFMSRSFKWSLPHHNTLDVGLITLVTSADDY